MKTFIIILSFLTTFTSYTFSQCSSLFSFAAYFENVTFNNQSNVSNAHYFWNFGDGTGSNFENPIHKFPETGNYLVTLFSKDTVSNCASYYEYWVNVTKYSTDICQTSITDSVFVYNGNNYLKIIDNSTNCENYFGNLDGGPGSNYPPNNWIWLGSYWHNYRMVSRIQYYTDDTTVLNPLMREAYKTSLLNYSSSKNYDDCSANFEFVTLSQDSTGKRIQFTAMNKTASSYEWLISGFGNPILSNYDTISILYPYTYDDLWRVALRIQGSSGCFDTLFQNILVRDENNTFMSDNETENTIQFSLIPNPMQDELTITISEFNEYVNFSLYNLNGQLLKEINNITASQITIHRENYASGLYFVTFKTNDGKIATGKIIME